MMILDNLHILLYGWLSLSTLVRAARILGIFTLGAKSHFLYNEGILRSLSAVGHRITIITPFSKEECLKNYTVIDFSFKTMTYVDEMPIDSMTNQAVHELLPELAALEEPMCYNVLRLNEIQEILNSKEKKFDIMFVELFFMYECFLPIAEKMGIPVIGTIANRSWKFSSPLISTYPSNPSIGNPYHWATIPFELLPLSKTMKFSKRLQNSLYCIYADLFYYFVISSKIETIYRQHYPIQYWHKKKLSLIFYNNHQVFLQIPMVPNAIDVGGVHLRTLNSLPQAIQKFIDEAKHGVILFTLGSLVKSNSLCQEVVNTLKSAFAAIPQRVIWKFEGKIDGLPDNILTISWVPQREILAHKNVKAFISHCGISGTYEAIHEGKPMVLTPLFGDQLSNAAILEELGVGVYLDIFSATKDTVLNSLNSIINDTKYRDSMREISRKFKDRPMTPQETIVYWTEYVIRHNGAPHLRTIAADMPLHQYLLLDVIFFVIIVTFIMLYVIYFILRRIYDFFFQHVTCRTENKKDH